MKSAVKNIAMIALYFGLGSVCAAQNDPPKPMDGQQIAVAPPAAPPAPSALPTPTIMGPLQALPPATFDAGPFGKIAVNGLLDGLGMWTGNHVPGDNTTQAALSNGQVFLQKTDGWFQFFLQAGATTLRLWGRHF